MVEEILKEIGLSKNEIKIYLALIELGPSLIGKICGKTKIHRRNVYDSLETLKNKGFVSSILINNRNVFESINPRSILDILDEKKAHIEKIIPSLLEKQNKSSVSVKLYSGLSGRKIIFEDKLKIGGEQYVLGAHKPSKKSLLYIENYHGRRASKKISLKMLFIDGDKESVKEFLKYGFVEARILPKKIISPIAINIYGDKIAILLNSGSVEPLTLLIEDKNLASDFKYYFEMLWKISKLIKR